MVQGSWWRHWIPAPNKLPEFGNAAEWMTLTAALRKKYSLKLNFWEGRVGNPNTITTLLHKDNKCNLKGLIVKIGGMDGYREVIGLYFGPKTRPIGTLQHGQGEQDWRRISG